MARKKSRPTRRIVTPTPTPMPSPRDAGGDGSGTTTGPSVASPAPAPAGATATGDVHDGGRDRHPSTGNRGGGGGGGGGGIVASPFSNLFSPSSTEAEAATTASSSEDAVVDVDVDGGVDDDRRRGLDDDRRRGLDRDGSTHGLVDGGDRNRATTTGDPTTDRVAGGDGEEENGDVGTAAATPRRRVVRLEVLPASSSSSASSSPEDARAPSPSPDGGDEEARGVRGGEGRGGGGGQEPRRIRTSDGTTLGLTLSVGDGGAAAFGGCGGRGGSKNDDDCGESTTGASSSRECRGVDEDDVDADGASESTPTPTPTPTIGRFVLRSTSSSSSPSPSPVTPGCSLRLSVSLDGGGSDDPGATAGFGETTTTATDTVRGLGDERVNEGGGTDAPIPASRRRRRRTKGVVLSREDDLEDVLSLCLLRRHRDGGGDDDVDAGGDGEGRVPPPARWRRRVGPLVEAVLAGLVSLSVGVSPFPPDADAGTTTTSTSSGSGPSPGHRVAYSGADVVEADALEVTLSLTPRAFDACSPPRSVGRRPAAPLPLRSNHLSGERSPALVLRSALALLYPNTVVADVAGDPNPGGGRGNGDGDNEVITAKMIYRVVDDAHSTEWCCPDESHGRHGCLGGPGRGGGGDDGGDDDGGGGDIGNGNGVDDAVGGGGNTGSGGTTPHQSERPKRRLEVEGLRPTLRPYQEAAVRWMLSREMAGSAGSGAENENGGNADNVTSGGDDGGAEEEDSCWELAWVVLDLDLGRQSADAGLEGASTSPSPVAGGKVTPLYRWRGGRGGGGGGRCGGEGGGGVAVSPPPPPTTPVLFYNPFTGWLCRSVGEARRATLGHFAPARGGGTGAGVGAGAGAGAAPSAEKESVRRGRGGPRNHRVRGGILADSMGTGKTVEVLACILSNRCPDANVGGGSFGVTAVDETKTNDVEMREELVEEAGAATTTTIGTDGGGTGPMVVGDDVADDPPRMRPSSPPPRAAGGSPVAVVSPTGSSDSSASSSSSSSSSSPSSSSGGHGSEDDDDKDGSTPRTPRSPTSSPAIGAGPCSDPSSPPTGRGDADDAARRGSGHRHHPHAARSVTTSAEGDDEDKGDDDDGGDRGGGDGGACVCGRDFAFRGCLGWVACRGCGERMHGLCAGFFSMEGVRRSCRGVGCGSSSPRFVCPAERCPCCAASASLSGCGGDGGGGEPTIKSRATLIVTPPSILEQWRREIRRHTTNTTTTTTATATARRQRGGDGAGLKVVVYPGMKELCGGNASSRSAKKVDVSLVHPRRLADADVVLTTFQALMGDLGHSGDNPCLATTIRSGDQQRQRRRLRKRKRFRVVPSPLTCITWWRVCLDEAQRVEAPTAASARMALLLPSRHRWCVTGTPVGRGRLDDLYGLLLFLGVVPFGQDRAWFRHCLHGSHIGATDRLSHLLRDVLWRSTKANDCVRLQMGIPQQEERRVVLKFSSVERHFYQRQLEETILAASSVQRNSGGENRRFPSARKKEATALSMQLHRLRAACCHPQVGSGGLGRAFGASRSGRGAAARGGGGVSSSGGVLTMDQILDRLIDDAKTKCEESLRLAVLHSNALASLARLKVEARGRYCRESDVSAAGNKSDRTLLLESGGIYMDSLSLMNSNATPCEVAGEAVLNGSSGFLDPRRVVRDGMAVLRWQLKCWDEQLGVEKGNGTSHTSASSALLQRQVWARIDFEGPAKKLISFRVRQLRSLPEDYDNDSWRLLPPKRCVLQCSNASVGGEFVDVRSFEMTFSDGGGDDWLAFDGFRTNKSKSWRIVVNDYHEGSTTPLLKSTHSFVALEVQFFEPNIAADDLQRQHIMHNAMIVFGAVLQYREGSMHDEDDVGGAAAEPNGVQEKLVWMHTESEKLDKLYMGTARVVHRESKRQLQRATESRAALESEVESLRSSSNDARDVNYGKEPWLWWRDFLTLCHIHGTEDQNAALCEAVQRDVAAFLEQFENSELNTTENRDRYSFPSFNDEDGLFAALSFRMQSIGVADDSLETQGLTSVKAVAALSENPSEGDVVENGNCRKCRDYFFQTGPKCRHCKLEECLLADEAKLLVEESSLMCALKALAKWLADNRMRFNGCHYQYLAFLERSANKFFEVHASYRKEMILAKRAWRAHFDLLSDLDELSQSKSSMRLLREGEDMCSVQPYELDAVVPPGGIDTLCMDHDSKQAMAMSTLRRNKDTLRYLRNQSIRRKEEVRRRQSSSQAQVTNRSSGEEQDGEKQTCVVCLCDFAGEHAVLACGHCFHYSPCLEKLAKGGGSGTTIACPMRCIVRTRKDEIFIASDKRRDDGSRISRSIEGCWGTKVERLVSDVMDIIEMGEKSLVFSQWDDMLAIVEEAFSVNGIQYVRPKGQKSMGSSVLKFRNGTAHPVLLMNVKSGAEGLTLVEATHVFMIEPLLNCGLDQQAINRVHRIGQTCKTFVHRYIIENTIEGKIDELRVERQGPHHENELAFKTPSRDSIPAGGIDGGFSRDELHRILHF